MHLKVIKADGSVEEYLHTKIIGTANNALSATGQVDIAVSQELAEVVTYFLHQKQGSHFVTSSEIFSMIEAVLSSTGNNEAAAALSEHHFQRKLKRSRIEVVSVDVQDLADAEMLCCSEQTVEKSRWDKSIIVKDLVTKHRIPRQTARTIASMVEEKIINLDATIIPASLVKQLVLSNTAAVLHAEKQLQTV